MILPQIYMKQLSPEEINLVSQKIEEIRAITESAPVVLLFDEDKDSFAAIIDSSVSPEDVASALNALLDSASNQVITPEMLQ